MSKTPVKDSTHDSSTQSAGHTAAATARPLGLDDWLRDERVIGLGALLPAEIGPSVSVPKRDTIMKFGRIAVPAAEGRPIVDRALHRQAVDEFRRRTGATWVNSEVEKAMQVVDHLASEAMQDKYSGPGVVVTWDDPGKGYYRIAAEVDGIHVQCTGQLDAWLSCTVARILTREQALDGVTPSVRPVIAMDLVRSTLPTLSARSWQESATSVPANVVDLRMQAADAELWGGVRAFGPIGAEERYAYCLRVNVP